jgi:hypothetical protein
MCKRSQVVDTGDLRSHRRAATCVSTARLSRDGKPTGPTHRRHVVATWPAAGLAKRANVRHSRVRLYEGSSFVATSRDVGGVLLAQRAKVVVQYFSATLVPCAHTLQKLFGHLVGTKVVVQLCDLNLSLCSCGGCDLLNLSISES